MNSINRYLKIAKDAVIKPSGDMDEKIIDRISHIKSSDKRLLDEKFMDYFSKSNSRAYLMLEKIKNNPGVFAVLAIAMISVIIVIFYHIAKRAKLLRLSIFADLQLLGHPLTKFVI